VGYEDSSDDHRLIGATLGGRYSVDRLLHQGRRNDLFIGGEGVDASHRAVVLKVPHELSNESAMVLGREAGFLTNLDHPNVVRSLDVGSDEHHAFLVLEPIVGETLAEIMERNGPMPEPEVLEIFWQILSAARAMHDAGIVHRDLRPRNVCLERREGHPPLVKLIDFAAARFMRPDHPDARGEPPYPIGAHRYMAPEQLRGEETGPWVDLYAIGMMLHAALVSELAEPGQRVRDKRDVAPELDEVVAMALAESPGDRFASALAFQDALTRALLIGG
jgi:eukaryotic-like serine/threonine-protein kinase